MGVADSEKVPDVTFVIDGTVDVLNSALNAINDTVDVIDGIEDVIDSNIVTSDSLSVVMDGVVDSSSFVIDGTTDSSFFIDGTTDSSFVIDGMTDSSFVIDGTTGIFDQTAFAFDPSVFSPQDVIVYLDQINSSPNRK